MSDHPKQVRLNKDDHKNVDKIKKLMKSANISDADITLSSAIRWALAKTAK